MSFLKCCSNGGTGMGSEGSGFIKSISLKLSTLTKGVHMTLLKSMWRSVVLAGIAGVLMFAGGALAAPTVAVTTTTSAAWAGLVANTAVSGTTLSLVFTLTEDGDVTAFEVDAALQTGKAGFKPSNLPAGLEVGTLTRTEDKVVTVTYTGTPTTAAAAGNLTFTALDKDLFDEPATSDVAVSGTISCTVGAAATAATVTVTTTTQAAWSALAVNTAVAGSTLNLVFTLNEFNTVAAYVADGALQAGKAGFKPSNLPAGLDIGVLTRTGDKVVTVTYTGTPTTAAAAGNLTFTALDKDLFSAAASANVAVAGSVSRTVTGAGGTVTTPTISINGAASNDNKLTSGAGGAANAINAAIIQYEGNITERLNVSATIGGLPSSSTFTADTGFRYTWFRTTAANEAGIVYSGTNQNTNMVKSTTTSALGGAFFQLPENLTAEDATTSKDYKYFVRVEAPSLGSQSNPVSKISGFVTITVKPRPVITISAQPQGYFGSTGTRDALVQGSISSATLTLTAAANPTVTIDGNTAAVAYQWYWVANSNGTGGGSLGSDAGANTATYTIPTGLVAGVYYYRCEVNYVLTVSGVTTNLSIPVRSTVVRVDVNPPAGGAELIPATAKIDIPDVTTLTYDVPALATSSTGTKLMVALPTSNIVTGMPAATTGQAYTWTIAQIDYVKILKTGGTAYTTAIGTTGSHSVSYTTLGAQNKNHGVLHAGTYEVSVKVTGELKTGSTVDKTFLGWKKVLLTVNPKNLTALTAAGFSVKAPERDSVYNGLKKTPLVVLKDVNDLTAGKDYFVEDPSNAKSWIDAGTANVTVKGCADNNTAACGSAGDANYIGSREGSFTIRRLPLAVNAAATMVASKDYDGTDTVAASSVVVDFTPSRASLPDVLVQGVDFVVSGAKFDNKDVGTRNVSNITVRLDETNSPLAKNYTFGAVNAAANLSATFSKSGVAITKRDITGDATIKSMLSYTIPTNHRYNGQARGIGAVAWKANVTNPNQAAFEIFYAKTKVGGSDVTEAPTSTLPKGDEGAYTTDGSGNVTWTNAPGSRDVEYAVSVSVRGGSNFNDGTIYFGTDDVYKIAQRARLASIAPKPSRKNSTDWTGPFINGTTEDTTVYVGMSLSLKVTPVRPDSLTGFTLKDSKGQDSVANIKYQGGTFAYQWFKVKDATSSDGTADKWDTLKTASAKTDTYTLPLPLVETKTTDREYYQVRVIWTYAAVTVPDTQFLHDGTSNAAIRVRIGPEAVSLTNATVAVAGTFPYTGVIYNKVGAAVDNQGSSTVTVTVPGVAGALTSDDYTFTSYGLNAGTGAGTVTVTGKNAYKGTVIGYFDIDQIVTDESYLVFGTTKQYNDSIQEFTVAPRSPFSGLGKVDRVYLTPKVGGEPDEYDTLKTAPKAVGSYIVSVTIEEGQNFTAMDEFKKPFNIVKRVLTDADFTYNFPKDHAYTGVAVPVVKATLNSSVKGYTKGYKVVMLQGNTETELKTMPTAEGSYPIYISVEGDANFANAMVLLGTYTIHEEGWVGVKGSDREVPKSDAANVAAVAPVKVVASGFTAGPSPVKAGSAIKFFSAKSVKSGTLYIFDANGNAVAKIAAKSASGEIGSWNLKDKKGASVTEGTYVVKGALLGKDGSKEKVSFPFSVVK